ncbi:MAG: Mrp/NBP35 family ATP-binding protein [Desulfotomaculales bacterium]
MIELPDVKTNESHGAGNDTKKQPSYEKPHQLTHIKHILAVMSGKGGVGKSSVTALLASTLSRKGYHVGVLDADITGPSIPRMFGIKERPTGIEDGILPPETPGLGIRVMSMNLLLPKEDEAVIWRGPLIGGAIKQFWKDVVWGDLDFLLVDLPPGTSDAPLTVMQSLPLDGLIIVSSPQDLAVMIVRKAIRMAAIMNVPIIGLVENMAYVNCPKCGEKIFAFGEPQGEKVAAATGVPLLATLPVDPYLSRLADTGKIEGYVAAELEHLPILLEQRLQHKVS